MKASIRIMGPQISILREQVVLPWTASLESYPAVFPPVRRYIPTNTCSIGVALAESETMIAMVDKG